MEFEWDPDKAANNLEKHGVSFEVAWDFDWEEPSTYQTSASTMARFDLKRLGAMMRESTTPSSSHPGKADAGS